MNFFMEVAKLRAARLLWAQHDDGSSTPKNPASLDAAHPLPDLGRQPAPSRTPTTTSSAPRSRRWRRCSAAPSRCTPTRSTRRSRCRPKFSARIARNTQLILQRRPASPHVVDPLGGSLLRREPDRSAGRRGAGADRRGRGARRHDQGGRDRHAEAAHRGSRRAAPGARSTAARRSSSGSTSTSSDGRADVDILDIDNAAVRDAQIARLQADARQRATQARVRRGARRR